MNIRSGMAVRALLVSALVLSFSLAEQPVQWVCPMDPDVRSAVPAKCPKCGMKLVAGIPDALEYPVQLELTPPAPKPGKPVALRFRVRKPSGGDAPVLQLIHEKLFHLFLISSDLSYFAHEHPVLQKDSSFLW